MTRRGSLSWAIVVLTGAALVGCAGTEVANSEEDRAAVAEEAEAVIVSLFEAMNAAATDSVLDHYTAGPLVRISCTQVQDRSLFLTATEAYYRTRDSLAFEYDITESWGLGPDAAVVSASGRLPDVNGLFWTWVLQREEGELRILHEHESWAGCPEARGTRFHETGGGMGQVPEEAPDG